MYVSVCQYCFFFFFITVIITPLDFAGRFSPGKLIVAFLAVANELTDGRFTEPVTGKATGPIHKSETSSTSPARGET